MRSVFPDGKSPMKVVYARLRNANRVFFYIFNNVKVFSNWGIGENTYVTSITILILDRYPIEFTNTFLVHSN